jgi:hypothetical protein
MKRTVKLVLVIGVVAVIILRTASIDTFERKKEASLKAAVHKDVGWNENQQSLAFLPGTKFVPEGLIVEDNMFVVDSRRVDVNGDGTLEDVVLIGEKQDNNNPHYVHNLEVAIKDVHTGMSLASIGELNVGYEAKLFIGSFTASKNNDILVSFATGGSGGVSQYSLLTYKDNQVKPIVPQKDLNEGLTLKTQCLLGFILNITDKNTGYTATIDLHQGSADYEALGIYNKKGELLAKDPMVLIDGFGVLKPEDDNRDGIYELHGIQRISVGTHVNVVADAESVWTVDNGQLKLLSEKIKAYNL